MTLYYFPTSKKEIEFKSKNNVESLTIILLKNINWKKILTKIFEN